MYIFHVGHFFVGACVSIGEAQPAAVAEGARTLPPAFFFLSLRSRPNIWLSKMSAEPVLSDSIGRGLMMFYEATSASTVSCCMWSTRPRKKEMLLSECALGAAATMSREDEHLAKRDNEKMSRNNLISSLISRACSFSFQLNSPIVLFCHGACPHQKPNALAAFWISRRGHAPWLGVITRQTRLPLPQSVIQWMDCCAERRGKFYDLGYK